jgi:hypothetical protein
MALRNGNVKTASPTQTRVRPHLRALIANRQKISPFFKQLPPLLVVHRMDEGQGNV